MSSNKNDNILGFPRTFPSFLNQDNKSDHDNVLILLGNLLKNIECSVGQNEFDEITFSFKTELDGRKISLPKYFPNGCDDTIVPYLQELLYLNGYNLIVILQDNSSFHFLTEEEFAKMIKFPIDEYRANYRDDEDSSIPIPVYHPNVPYVWIWVDKKIAERFPRGDVDDFEEDSICFSSCYGEYHGYLNDI